MERISFQELLLQVEKKTPAREVWPGALSELSWIRRSAFITPPEKVAAEKKTQVVVVKEEPEEAPHQEGREDQQSVIIVEKGINSVAVDATAPAAGEPGPDMAAVGAAAVAGHAPQQDVEQVQRTEACKTEVVERACMAIDATVTGAPAPGPELADAGAAFIMESAPEDVKDAVMGLGSLSRAASSAIKVRLPQSEAVPDYGKQATAASGLSSFSNLEPGGVSAQAEVPTAEGEEAGDTAVSATHQHIHCEVKIETQEEHGGSADPARFGVRTVLPLTPTEEDKPLNSDAAMSEDGGEPISQPESTLEFVIRVLGPCLPTAVSAENFPGQVGDTTETVCCECKEPETADSTILCDKCDRSFHLECVNLGSEVATTVDEWLCNDCLSDGGHWKWRLRKIMLRPKEGEGRTVPEATAEAEAEACPEMEDQPVPRRMKLPTRRGRTSESQSSPKPIPATDIAASARASEALEGLRAYIAERNGILEEGWTAQIVPRQHSNGRMHINYWSPNKVMFKTRLKVAEYLGLHPPPSDSVWVRSEHAGGLEGVPDRAQHQQPCNSTDWSLPDPKQACNIPDVATNVDLSRGLKVDFCPVSREKFFSDTDSRVHKSSGSEKMFRDDAPDTTKRRKISGGTEDSEEWVPDDMEESEEWSRCVTSGTQKRPGVSREEIRSFVRKAHQKLEDYVAARGGVLEKGWTTHCMQVKQQTSLQAYYKSPSGKRFQSRVQIGALLNLPARPQSGAETAVRMRSHTPERDGSPAKLVSRPKLVPRPRLKLPAEQGGFSHGHEDDDPWSVMKPLIVPGNRAFQGSEDEDRAEDADTSMQEVPALSSVPSSSSEPAVTAPCIPMPTVPGNGICSQGSNGGECRTPVDNSADLKIAVSVGVQTDERWTRGHALTGGPHRKKGGTQESCTTDLKVQSGKAY